MSGSPYKRCFMVFRKEDGGYAAPGKEPAGHIKIEVRGGRAKADAFFSGLKEIEGGSYRLYLVKTGENRPGLVDAGIAHPRDTGFYAKWESSYADKNLNGFDIAELDAALLVVKSRKDGHITCPLAAYRDGRIDWRKVIFARKADGAEKEEREDIRSKEDVKAKEDNGVRDGGIGFGRYGDSGSGRGEDIAGIERDWDKERERDKDTDRDRDRSTDRDSHRDKERDWEKAGESEKNEERDRGKDRDRDRNTDKDRDKDNVSDRDGEREKESPAEGYFERAEEYGGTEENLTGNGFEDKHGIEDDRKRPEIERLESLFDEEFQREDPFRTNRKDYSWWRVESPVHLNNIMHMCGIRASILFNEDVMAAHHRYRHLIAGIFKDGINARWYLVCGIPGAFMIDRSPFGSFSRWARRGGHRPGYGSMGYWLVYIDPYTGNILRFN